MLISRVRMSRYHQASAKKQSEASETVLRFHMSRLFRLFVVRLHEHVATSSCRHPPTVATSQTRPCLLFSRNKNTPLPSTALPPYSSSPPPTFFSQRPARFRTYLHGSLLPPYQRDRQHALPPRRHRRRPPGWPGRRSGWYLSPHLPIY